MDLDRLSTWMAAHVPGFDGPVSAQKFDVGQSNPTYLLTAGYGRYVLRRKPDGELLKSAHAVDREYRVMAALADSDVPVPRMLAMCEDPQVLGTMFYVMEYVDGRGVVDPSMPDAPPEQRAAIMEEMARVLAAIHRVDLAATGLQDFGPEGSYFARQLARWTQQYRATQTQDLPDMEALIDWLAAHLPQDDGRRCLVHGDYRIDNLLFDPNGPRCLAVLDWELSTTGHPFADLAGVIMQWQLPTGSEGRGLAGVDRAAAGLPSDADFIARYCHHAGIAPPQGFGFYVAFAFFRMAAILQGVGKRALDGNAANPEKGLKLGTYVPRFAELGLEARYAHG
jgi:aminoglycoside phosphotransferase (APT) family kinase protein